MQETATTILDWLGRALFHSLWQAALLLFLYRVLVFAFGIRQPDTRFRLAGILLLSGLAWFVYSLIQLSPTETAYHDWLPEVSAGPAAGSIFTLFFPSMGLLYLVFLVMALYRLYRGWGHVGQLQKTGLSRAEADWRLFVRHWAPLMGIGREVKVWISEQINSPATIGFLRPVILLPLSAVTQLNRQQLEAILLHELWHIRRGDYILNLLLQGMRTVFYFNPFVQQLARVLEQERESSCDALVLRFRYDPAEYAGALLQLRQLATRQLLLPAKGNRKSELQLRIERMFGLQRPALRLREFRSFLYALLYLGLFGYLTAGSGKRFVFPLRQGPVYAHTTQPSQKDQITAPAVARSARSGKLSVSASAMPFREEEHTESDGPSPVIAAGYTVPLLSTAEEEQVQRVMAQTLLVLKNWKWNETEKEIAEVLDSREKEQVKQQLEAALQRQNWRIWENRLRQAYNQIEWERLSEKLEYALGRYQEDSLEQQNRSSLQKPEELKMNLRSLADEPGLRTRQRAIDSLWLRLKTGLQAWQEGKIKAVKL